MNVIKFIKEHGVEKAREVVEGAPENSICYDLEHGKHVAYEDTSIAMCFLKSRFIDLSDLKRLVESVELVKEHYTLDRAIEYANSQYTAPEIKVCLLDAIANYKSIYSDNNMGDCEILDHPEDYTSPNCKKFDERVK